MTPTPERALELAKDHEEQRDDLTLDKLASLRYADIMICHDRVSVRVAKRTAYQYFSWSKPFSSETMRSVIEEAIDAACEAYRQEWLDPKPDQQ